MSGRHGICMAVVIARVVIRCINTQIHVQASIGAHRSSARTTRYFPHLQHGLKLLEIPKMSRLRVEALRTASFRASADLRVLTSSTHTALAESLMSEHDGNIHCIVQRDSEQLEFHMQDGKLGGIPLHVAARSAILDSEVAAAASSERSALHFTLSVQISSLKAWLSLVRSGAHTPANTNHLVRGIVVRIISLH